MLDWQFLGATGGSARRRGQVPARVPDECPTDAPGVALRGAPSGAHELLAQGWFRTGSRPAQAQPAGAQLSIIFDLAARKRSDISPANCFISA